MDYFTTKKQIKTLLIVGSSVAVLLLAVPLIIYGFNANKSKSIYSKTTCHYNGYLIKDKNCGMQNLKYAGYLKYWFEITNTSRVYRDTNVYCSNDQSEIILYFHKYYNSSSVWDCWYQKSDPVGGWIGFRPPYNVSGTGMIGAGFGILGMYVIMIGTYMIIRYRKNNTSDYGPL